MKLFKYKTLTRLSIEIGILSLSSFGEPIQVHCEYLVDHVEPGPPSIHVLKFADLDGNGVQDPGEEGIPGWEITLQCVDANGNVVITITETDAAGMVWFENIPATSVCTVSEELRVSVPSIWSREVGAVVPIPTLPSFKTTTSLLVPSPTPTYC